MAKKSKDTKPEKPQIEAPELEDTKPEEPNALPEYLLADPRTANVAHGGVIFSVTNGKISCSSEVAQQLIAAGVLKA